MDLRYNSRIHIDANMTPTQLLPSRDTDFDDIQDHQSRALSDAFEVDLAVLVVPCKFLAVIRPASKPVTVSG